MTHFAVLVAGEDVEKRLAPYDENLEVDPHWVDDDFMFTAAAHQALAHLAGVVPYSDEDNVSREAIREKAKTITAEEAAKHLNTHEPGDYRAVDGRVQTRTTRNPDAKWDWWVVGGRFNNYWPIRKPFKGDESCVSYDDSQGGLMTPIEHRLDRADSAMVKAIDLEEMTSAAKENAKTFHRTITETVDEFGEIPLVPGIDEGTREAFQEWWNTPVVKTLVERLYDEPPIMLSPDDIVGPAETSFDDYVEYCAASSVIPYAVLDDDGWHAPGEMGFWAMSTDRFHDRVKFAIDMYDRIRNLPEDTWLTIVDCHI